MIRHIFRTAFKNKKHKVLILLTLFSMCLLTFATQLEILAIGVITKRGPDFFELFGETRNGKVVAREKISKKELEQRWSEIDSENKGYVTAHEVDNYLAQVKEGHILIQIQNMWHRIFPIS